MAQVHSRSHHVWFCKSSLNADAYCADICAEWHFLFSRFLSDIQSSCDLHCLNEYLIYQWSWYFECPSITVDFLSFNTELFGHKIQKSERGLHSEGIIPYARCPASQHYSRQAWIAAVDRWTSFDTDILLMYNPRNCDVIVISMLLLNGPKSSWGEWHHHGETPIFNLWQDISWLKDSIPCCIHLHFCVRTILLCSHHVCHIAW